MSLRASAVLFLSAGLAAQLPAQAPNIDKLLAKLPAPESVVRKSNDRSLLEAGQLQNDPLSREMAAALRGKDAARGLQIARSFTDRYPQNARAHLLRGSMAMINRQHVEAAAALRRASELNPKLGVAYFGQGVNLGMQRRFAEAIPPFKRAAELEPQNTMPLQALAECSFALGRKDESAGYLRRVAALAPSSTRNWLYLAKVENLRRDHTAALRALARAAELEPDNYDLQSGLGYGLINLKRDREAIPPLERAYRRNNRDPLLAGQLGYCYLRAEQFDKAYEMLRHATRLNGNYGPAWGHLGLIQRRKGQSVDALKSFRRGTELMPQDARAWRDYAQELRTAGQAAEAAKAEQRAAYLKPAATRRG